MVFHGIIRYFVISWILVMLIEIFFGENQKVLVPVLSYASLVFPKLFPKSSFFGRSSSTVSFRAYFVSPSLNGILKRREPMESSRPSFWKIKLNKSRTWKISPCRSVSSLGSNETMTRKVGETILKALKACKTT